MVEKDDNDLRVFESDICLFVYCLCQFDLVMEFEVTLFLTTFYGGKAQDYRALDHDGELVVLVLIVLAE